MRNLAIFFAILLTFFITQTPYNATADELTIVATGDIHGKITPTPGWGGVISGGLARVSTHVNQLRSKNPNILVMDIGGFVPFTYQSKDPVPFENKAIFADFALKCMEKIKYTVINLNANDLKYIKTDAYKIPFITSNLTVEKELPSNKTFEYIIHEVNDIKIAITGISPSHKDIDHIFAAKPIETLKRLIPELRAKADIIVLLSQFRSEITEFILDTSKVDIDLVLTRRASKLFNKNRLDESPYLIQLNDQCSSIQTISLKLDSLKKIQDCTMTKTSLKATIEDDPEILAITGEDINTTVKEINFQKVMDDAKKLHQLTPEEYVEMILKQQANENQQNKE